MTKDEALKQALEALEGVNPSLVCEMAHHSKKDQHGIGQKCPLEIRHLETIIAIKAALAQPDERNFCPRCGKRTKDIHTCTPQGEDRVPLYTTPPKREWVGLTEEYLEQIDTEEIYGVVGNHITIAMAVEAQLKERNK